MARKPDRSGSFVVVLLLVIALNIIDPVPSRQRHPDGAEVKVMDVNVREGLVGLEELLLFTCLITLLVVAPPLKRLGSLVPQNLSMVAATDASVGVVVHVAQGLTLVIKLADVRHPLATHPKGRA